MAENGYHIHITKAMESIANRFKNISVDDMNKIIGEVPEYQNTYPQRVAVEKNTSRNNGPTAIIDVQPDYRNIILYINYHVTREYPEIIVKGYPALTPPSLTGYLLALVYAYALLNDDENVRTMKSTYAHEFTTRRNLDRILTDLRRLPVPKFMMPLFTSLFAGFDERKPNILFVNSLACYDIEYDGRTPPINLYFTAHNIIASRPANLTPTALTEEWMNTTLVQHPVILTVSNFLGTRIENLEYYNWFCQINTALFNPVTMRSNTVRPTFRQMETFPQNVGNNLDNVNPYIHLLNLDDVNLFTTQGILNDIGKSISEHFDGCLPLGQIEHSATGRQIINHYYQPVTLPTYSRQPATASTTSKRVDPQTFANGMHFIKPPIINANVTIAIPEESASMHKHLYLAHEEPYSRENDPIQYQEFDISTHLEN
ncbi:uncharacterized protein LOC116351805 [Contarinia nasturtii]|uniref:uncharacterized protein LOC116351805 n=1 Tax=Contarinia nasturtii TaxID=265458 RepID=UPI0012D42B18|nr:uncharacterized protein LOC116351805 [Contarinia nasturtii]